MLFELAKSNDELGAHFVALSDVDAGTIVVRCAALEEALAPPFVQRHQRVLERPPGAPDPAFRCERCKRPTQGCCWGCGAVAFCERCKTSSEGKRLKQRHTDLECRAFNQFALLFEQFANQALKDQDWQRAFECSSGQLLLLLLRLAIHGWKRDRLLYGPSSEDPWAMNILANTTEILTHRASRSQEDLDSVLNVSRCIYRLANLSGSAVCLDVDETANALMRCQVNAFEILDPCTQLSLGVGFYPTGSIFNHDCWPNADYLIGQDGEMRVVTTRSISKGEHITIQYTDTISTPCNERQAYLEKMYHFTCRCKRCLCPSDYDTALQAGTVEEIQELARLKQRAEKAQTIEQGLKCFVHASRSLLAKGNALHFAIAHGVLIHAEALGDHKQIANGAKRLLKFYQARDSNQVNCSKDTFLPIAQVGLLLKYAFALRCQAQGLDPKAGHAFLERGVPAIQLVIRCLRAFQIDLSGLEAWLEVSKKSSSYVRVSEDTTIDSIFWGGEEKLL